MVGDLVSRREILLKLIVSEYIATAMPVASESLLRQHKLGVSSATIRNDMARLEEEGYITRPHISAGTIPRDKGYRYYVKSISNDVRLPDEEQTHILKSFQEVEEELDKWLKLAAFLIAHLVGNAALVTFPKANKCRFKHLELVSLHEFLAMLIVVLSETILKKQLISFSLPITQEQLTNIANKLNNECSGLTSSEIPLKKPELTNEEKRITEAVVDIMATEDRMEYSELYFEGLRLMLGQPEFIKRDRMLDIMELMEEQDWLRPVLDRQSENEGIQVIIGEENEEDAMKDLSLIVNHYGIPQKISGTIGVIGPTRMDYRRAISTVGYVSEIINQLIAGVWHEDQH